MVKILVVDDNESIRKLICAYLEQESYKVFHAGNGVEALEVTEKNHIDLMIADIMMPQKDIYPPGIIRRYMGYGCRRR